MKTKFPPPIYHLGAERYEIDDCQPQIKAQREGKIELHALSKGHYPGTRMKMETMPGLSSVGFWNSRRNQDWGLQPHRNEGIEIVYLASGSTGFEVDGDRHALKSGDMTITRPWQLHRLGNPDIGHSRLSWLILDVGVRRPNQDWKWPEWLVLSREDLAELAVKLRLGEKSVWTACKEIRVAFREISHCVLNWGGGLMESRLKVAVNRLLLGVHQIVVVQQREHIPELAIPRHTVDLFLRDLSENPASCSLPWTLQTMAGHCGMGITSLSKYCRELVNNGPVAYLAMCRLEHAAKSLRENPRASVTEIAMGAGFNSSQYFATLFRRRFGMAPRDFRSTAGNAPPSPRAVASAR